MSIERMASDSFFRMVETKRLIFGSFSFTMYERDFYIEGFCNGAKDVTTLMGQNEKLVDSYKRGVRDCINALRSLQDQYRHESRWNHSGKTQFAPVELSDYLLTNVYNKTINQG